MEVAGAGAHFGGAGQRLRRYAVFVKQSKRLVRQFGLIRKYGIVGQHGLIGLDGQQRLQWQFRLYRFLRQQRVNGIFGQQRFGGQLGIDGKPRDCRRHVGRIGGGCRWICRGSAN